MVSQVGAITRVTILSSCINLLLAGLKLAVGIVAGSVALVADAAHSISDLSTDAVVVLGVRLSSRPADESHAYGHGKYETCAAFLVGAVLVAVGVLIARDAGLSLYRHEHNFPGYAVLIVAAVSIASKEGLYQITQRVARRVRSPALRANAWHQRSDALSSVAVLFGAIAGQIGWGHGDQLAAVAVGVMISVVGLNVIWRAFVDFTESSIPVEEQKSIAEVIQGVPGVRGWHRLRTRLVGREVFMDLHLLVDAQLSVAEGHEICNAVESAVEQAMERPINILVHLEPARDPTVNEKPPENQMGKETNLADPQLLEGERHQ